MLREYSATGAQRTTTNFDRFVPRHNTKRRENDEPRRREQDYMSRNPSALSPLRSARFVPWLLDMFATNIYANTDRYSLPG